MKDTIVIDCSSSSYSGFGESAQIRLTYEAINGVFTIYSIYGYRSDGNRSYDETAKNIIVTVGNKTKSIRLNHYVDFGTTWTTFGINNTVWENLPEGQLTLVVKMPNSEATFSEATFTNSVNMPYASYSISYDANGGIEAPSTQLKKYNTNINLSKIVPKKEGYEFVQWTSINPNMTLQPGDVVTYNGDLNLTAEWAATAWLKNKIITVETLGVLHEYNKNTFATEDSASELREELGAIESRVTPIENGGTNSADGATGLANLFAAGNTVLSSYQYGNELPDAGIAGRIFFKRLIEE